VKTKIVQRKASNIAMKNNSATLPLRFYTLVIFTIKKCEGYYKVRQEFTNKFFWKRTHDYRPGLDDWILRYWAKLFEQQYWSKVLLRDCSTKKKFQVRFGFFLQDCIPTEFIELNHAARTNLLQVKRKKQFSTSIWILISFMCSVDFLIVPRLYDLPTPKNILVLRT